VHDVLPAIVEAHRKGEAVGMATVIQTWKSAPQPPGAAMLVRGGGEVFGSVSGGCVEGALYEIATAAIESGTSSLETFGVSDEDAFEVGLTCGGTIEVFVEKVGPELRVEFEALHAQVSRYKPVALVTVIESASVQATGHLVISDSDVVGSLEGTGALTEVVVADALGFLAAGKSGVLSYGPHGQRLGRDIAVFVNSIVPAPHMYIFGAADHAAALCTAGKLLGFRVTVVDARSIFSTRQRFPDADEVVVDWPHRWLASQTVDQRTVICVLTHDPKFDVPALQVAVHTDACYIGAMGSRKTHEDRIDRLMEAGLTSEQIGRIHAPIGLDLGARTPEETAVSIAAEIVRERWGGTARSLSETNGPIHHVEAP
jgi:xanthine dehydrogenase accessory factor